MEVRLRALYTQSMQGNQEDYSCFLELSGAIVRKYLGYLGGKYEGQETLEDLVQEVLLSIHQKKHTYQMDRPILPWIYAITRYRFIDHYRSRKREPLTVELTNEMALELDKGQLFDFEEIMHMLSPKQKELLRMIKIEGASYSEAAQALEMSVPSVKVGLHRILKSIKEKAFK